MKAVRAIDAWLIARLESVTHGIQRLTGITCYRLALYAFAGYPVGWTVAAFWKPGWFDWTIAVVLGITALALPLATDSIEQRAFERLRRGLANPEKARGHLGRILSAIGSVILLCYPDRIVLTPARGNGYHESVAIEIGLTFYALWLYLCACDPLPPATSKIREWLNSFRPAPQPARENA